MSRHEVNLWQEELLTERSPQLRSAFVMFQRFRCAGDLDIAALREAADRVVERHRALRDTFHWNGAAWYQREIEHSSAEFRIVGETAVSTSTALPAQAHSDFQPGGFRLDRGPFLRVTVDLTSREEFLVDIEVDHYTADGMSFKTILGDLGLFYNAAVRGEEPRMTAIAATPADFAVWQRRYVTAERERWFVDTWKERLRGAQPPNLGSVPWRRESITTAYSRQALHSLPLSALQHAARVRRVTPFMIAAAAYARALSTVADSPQVIFRTPFFGRTDDAYLELVGFTVNVLPLRLTVTDSGEQLLHDLRRGLADLTKIQSYPFRKVRRALSAEPAWYPDISQVPYFTIDTEARLDLTGVTTTPIPVDEGDALTPCSTFLTLGASASELYVMFDEGCVKRATAEALISEFVKELEDLVSSPVGV